MKNYLELSKRILKNGILKNNRTKFSAISTFGEQIIISLTDDSIPVLTTKKMYFRAIVGELLWFISGSTNITWLVKNNIHIWDEWAFELFKKTQEYKQESIQEFVNKLIKDNAFAVKYGELGPIYGKAWRNWYKIDQLKEIINKLKTDPDSRRIIMTAWDPNTIKNTVLPPCHILLQLSVTNKRLSGHVYQRSADIFLGVPFNIASYSLLLKLLARECNLRTEKLIITFGDAHIYTNHIPQILEQLKRNPRPRPLLKISKTAGNIFNLKISDIELQNYNPYSALPAEVAV